MRYTLVLVIVMILCSVSHGGERKSFTWRATSSIVRDSNIRQHDVEGRDPLYGVVFKDVSEYFVMARIAIDTMTEKTWQWDTVSGKDWKWDGKSLQLSSMIFVAAASPSENISLDWVGQCTFEDLDDGTKYGPKMSTYNSDNWPVKTLDGVMKAEMLGKSQYDLVKVETAGDIPLNGCDRDEPGKRKILWLKGSVDVIETTTPMPEKYLFLSFTGSYGTLGVQNPQPGN